MQNLKTVPVSICFIVGEIRDQSYSLWLQKRSDEDEQLNQKWEAPGGKWESGETPEEACRREVKEETGIEISRPVFFKDYYWENGDKLIALHTFLSQESIDSEKGKWFEISFENPLNELEDKIPPVNHLIIKEMSSYLERYKERVWEV